MKKVLTGLQPTGDITLGNYIGAIKQMLKYQEEYESYIFVADLHSITIPQEPDILKSKIRSLIALYLACGIDPEKNIIFIQSENPYHTNVSWLLECNTYFGELSRMTQFKDKSSKNENFTTGLFTYPVLMASDILIYDIDYVPVGKDQKQHVEIARDIAGRFNKKYGDTFQLPEPLIAKVGDKIMDLIDPTKKMSKSAQNKKGVIHLLDEEKVIRKKIMGATTDSIGKVTFDPINQPGISNLLTIYTCLSGLSMKQAEEQFKESNYGMFKKALADLVVETIIPIQQRYNELLSSNQLDEILDKGAKYTTEIASQKYKDMKIKMGLCRK